MHKEPQWYRHDGGRSKITTDKMLMFSLRDWWFYVSVCSTLLVVEPCGTVVDCMGESFQDYSWIQDFEADSNPELGRFLWLLWFNFSLSKDNWPFKLEIVDIYRYTACFKIFKSSGFWKFWTFTHENVRLRIQASLVQDSREALCVLSLSATLFPPLSTVSIQENWKLSR